MSVWRACLCAVLGGCLVEKHITLDNNAGGLDDPVALTPREFKEMSDTVRAVEVMAPSEGFSYLTERFSKQRVYAALGNGIKQPSRTERDYYSTTNRSIMAVRDIREGSIIGSEEVALLRSEKNLTPGLPPKLLSMVIGRKARRSIPDGSGVTWDDF